MILRCDWVTGADKLYQDYHDREWGTPTHDDRKLFEFLVLEGFQAGLSWWIILKKRQNFRAAFDGFDPRRIAEYSGEKVDELLLNPGIIRNRRKIEAAIHNAQVFQRLQQEFGSFDAYLWGFVSGETRHNGWKSMNEIPARTPESDALSKDLGNRGFKFVGSTICYAFMQAVGLVNDHVLDCFRYQELVAMTPRV